MIREATAADLDRIVELGAAFHAYCPYADIPLDRAAFRDFAVRLIDGGVILLSDDGMLGGLLSPIYFNPAFVGGAELFWWAGSSGQALRTAFEAWARAKGAHLRQFTGLRDARSAASERMFRAAGYVPVETGFRKDL